jgi:O-acetyl-ADP-ribose deacetylase (regulator of RNase III)
MPFQIIRNDITKVKADAIVNTANPRPAIGSGTDSAVYAAAGEELLLAERKKIGDIEPGCAVCTPAFNLSAKYIIHTVGPAWVDGNHGERDTLRSCYARSLSLAAELSCESIAFPMIATGVYGFPKDEALNIALAEIGRFLLTHEMKVILVVFDRKALELSKNLVGGNTEYIDEHSVSLLREEEYGSGYNSSIRRRMDEERMLAEERRRRMDAISLEEELEDSSIAPPSVAPFPDIAGKSLDEVLGGDEDTFQQRLFKLIDSSGMDDVTVYKKANIDRKVFSRIRCKADYKPKKKTAVAFAIALELDMPTMLDLLSRAEIAFSPSNKFDLIVSYFITNGNYDIFEINAALFKYGQPILGE